MYFRQEPADELDTRVLVQRLFGIDHVADDIELVEFGDTVCRDVTRTLVDVVNAWCTTFTKIPIDRSPAALRRAREGTSETGTQPPGGPFVVIWERR